MTDNHQKNLINHYKTVLNVQKERMNASLEQLNAGNTPMMSGFEEEIISVCKEIEKAPPIVAHALKYDMKDVIGTAEELIQALEAHKAQLQDILDQS